MPYEQLSPQEKAHQGPYADREVRQMTDDHLNAAIKRVDATLEEWTFILQSAKDGQANDNGQIQVPLFRRLIKKANAQLLTLNIRKLKLFRERTLRRGGMLVKVYTDYPITELGDMSSQEAPIREITVLAYDQDKYATIRVDNVIKEIKAGYIYLEPGRLRHVPVVPIHLLERLPHDFDADRYLEAINDLPEHARRYHD